MENKILRGVKRDPQNKTKKTGKGKKNTIKATGLLSTIAYHQ